MTRTLIIHSLSGTKADGTPIYTRKRIHRSADTVILPFGGEIVVTLPVAHMFPGLYARTLEPAAE